MDEEKFKAIRHRFWRLGREKRNTLIKEMGFAAPEYQDQFLEKKLDKDGNEVPGVYTQSIENEVVQRKILYFIVEGGRQEELEALIEVQEEILAAEEEAKGGDRVRVVGRVLGETPPSKEELASIKYVAGGKKPWEKGA